jgi:general stress protein 26
MKKEMNDIKHFSKLIKDIKFAMLTTANLDNGTLYSRPMTLQQVEFDGDLWFFANRPSELAHQVEMNPKVNLSFSNVKDFSFLSAKGSAQIIDDKAKAAELWNPLFKTWFKEGLEDPNLCLIKVRVEEADYWESPDSKIVRLIGFAKAIVKGERNNSAIGHHGHLSLN